MKEICKTFICNKINFMKISIIIASYNYAEYIEEAINSVINQSYQDWELIIVDDGSNDGSIEIIKSYYEKDNRIRFFQHAQGQNRGLKETLLLGIKHASGDWIAFLESDDYFSPDNLAKKIESIKKYPYVNLIFNKVKFLSEEKRKQQKIFENIQKKLSKKKFPKNMFYDFYIDNTILTFSSVMTKKKVLQNVNFDTPFDAALDRWLWVHLAYNNNFYYIDEELTFWRLHPQSYILKSKKSLFYFPQINAYYDIYKKDKKSLLLLFILYSFIILLFTKIFRNIL